MAASKNKTIVEKVIDFMDKNKGNYTLKEIGNGIGNDVYRSHILEACAIDRNYDYLDRLVVGAMKGRRKEFPKVGKDGTLMLAKYRIESAFKPGDEIKVSVAKTGRVLLSKKK